MTPKERARQLLTGACQHSDYACRHECESCISEQIQQAIEDAREENANLRETLEKMVRIIRSGNSCNNTLALARFAEIAIANSARSSEPAKKGEKG